MAETVSVFDPTTRVPLGTQGPLVCVFTPFDENTLDHGDSFLLLRPPPRLYSVLAVFSLFAVFDEVIMAVIVRRGKMAVFGRLAAKEGCFVSSWFDEEGAEGDGAFAQYLPCEPLPDIEALDLGAFGSLDPDL